MLFTLKEFMEANTEISRGWLKHLWKPRDCQNEWMGGDVVIWILMRKKVGLSSKASWSLMVKMGIMIMMEGWVRSKVGLGDEAFWVLPDARMLQNPAGGRAALAIQSSGNAKFYCSTFRNQMLTIPAGLTSKKIEVSTWSNNGNAVHVFGI